MLRNTSRLLRRVKIVAKVYPDPVDGYPPTRIRDSIPEITKYPDGQTTPTPSGRDGWQPGDLLGCKSGALGLRQFCEKNGWDLVVTTDATDPEETNKELKDADVVISQPFWPFYLTKERMEGAPNLKIAITAGIGSDHTDLGAAIERKVDVAEVTYCNSESVAEHIIMQALIMVRNYNDCHAFAKSNDGWNIADCVKRAYDIEGMTVGTIASGRIGLAALERFAPFGCKLHYNDRHRLPKETEERLNLTFHESVEEMVSVCDLVTINCPLHPETDQMFDAKLINKMKRGSYIVNTARGKICNANDIRAALESGQLAGYAGDVWFPQPAPAGHPWRSMPNSAMTPHVSGTTLSAQTRYCAGVREILEDFFINEKPIRSEYQIVKDGKLAGTGAHSYSEGNATGGALNKA